MELVSGYEKLTKGGIQLVETKSLMEQIREEAARRVMAKESGRFGLVEFYDRLISEGLVVWLEFWPRICEDMRRVNFEKQKMLQEISNKGKFTESYGWSDEGHFKTSWEYTPEFYFFIRNYVYRGFFEEEDEKPIKERFMRAIMRGGDYVELLVQLKKRYGSNHQENPVVVGGGLS